MTAPSQTSTFKYRPLFNVTFFHRQSCVGVYSLSTHKLQRAGAYENIRSLAGKLVGTLAFYTLCTNKEHRRPWIMQGVLVTDGARITPPKIVLRNFHACPFRFLCYTLETEDRQTWTYAGTRTHSMSRNTKKAQHNTLTKKSENTDT